MVKNYLTKSDTFEDIKGFSDEILNRALLAETT